MTHLAGTSVGRALEAYRKLRTAEPDLVSQVDIMSQPAANVDSVILTWVIQGQSEEFPASVWQRDCFSSVFAEAPTQAMALANQLSCLVAAKCTAKLQITDSDFAKQFKALVRHCLTQQRTEFQELSKKTAESPLWRVGAKELVSAVVYAQAKMAEKNSDEWVLRAAVRNGILAYRPNLQSAKLEELLSQPWAEALTEKLAMGSRRFPPEWLSDRLRWLEKSGKPKEPDWRLSNSAKQLSDLLRWDYFNPEEDAEKEAEDEEPELGAELAEELELPLQNSLSLRLHPRLRRAAVRKAAEQTSEQKKLHAKHRKERQQRLALRQQLRGKLVQALRGKLLNSSRAELLGTLVPQARKLSSVTKPSVKSKPSAKTKLSKLAKKSALDKADNKQKLKKDADKAIQDEVKATKQAAASRGKGRGRPKKQPEEKPEEDLPPLPPPSCPPPELLEQTVICHAEAAGAKLFGVSGTATDFKAGSYSVLTLSGTFSIPAEYLRSHDPK